MSFRRLPWPPPPALLSPAPQLGLTPILTRFPCETHPPPLPRSLGPLPTRPMPGTPPWSGACCAGTPTGLLVVRTPAVSRETSSTALGFAPGEQGWTVLGPCLNRVPGRVAAGREVTKCRPARRALCQGCVPHPAGSPDGPASPRASQTSEEAWPEPRLPSPHPFTKSRACLGRWAWALKMPSGPSFQSNPVPQVMELRSEPLLWTGAPTRLLSQSQRPGTPGQATEVHLFRPRGQRWLLPREPSKKLGCPGGRGSERGDSLAPLGPGGRVHLGQHRRLQWSQVHRVPSISGIAPCGLGVEQ